MLKRRSTPYKKGERALKEIETKRRMAEMQADLERFFEEYGKEKGLREELANVRASLEAVREEMGEERRR
eukprot:12912437-Prorocentrum_lima.AAC.1